MPRDVVRFGDDGSPHSDRAWLWINAQRWPGWSVDVITARPRRWDVVTPDHPVELEPWTPSVPRRPDPRTGISSVRHLHTASEPRAVLSIRTDAAVTVVGPRGAQGRARSLLLGSTAEHLLHHPPGSLVIASTPNRASRVLVCVDGSEHARHAAETFATLPLAADADVWTIVVDHPTMFDEQGDRLAEIDSAIAATRDVLASFSPQHLRVESDEGVPVGIVTIVQEIDAQLLVLGTHGRSGFTRLLLGSTCQALARMTPCPLLVVPLPDRGAAPDQLPT